MIGGEIVLTISNCSFTNCGTGIKAPSTTYMNLSNNTFVNVGKCHDFYSENIQLETNASERKLSQLLDSRNEVLVPKQVVRDQIERRRFLKIVRSLFDLEHQARINGDQQNLKVIRKLKGLIGNQIFDDLFATITR